MTSGAAPPRIATTGVPQAIATIPNAHRTPAQHTTCIGASLRLSTVRVPKGHDRLGVVAAGGSRAQPFTTPRGMSRATLRASPAWWLVSMTASMSL